MLNNKTQKDKVREILKKNKDIAERNRQMAQIDKKSYKKVQKMVRKKLEKNPEERTVREYQGFGDFLKEAYACFLAEAEKLTLNKDVKVSEEKDTSSKKTKKTKTTSVSTATTANKVDKTIESPTKTVATNANSKVKKDSKVKSKEVTRTLSYPAPMSKDSTQELSNPFKETTRNDGNVQLGFSVPSKESSSISTKAKPKRKTSKNKVSSNIQTNTELQMSFLV